MRELIAVLALVACTGNGDAKRGEAELAPNAEPAAPHKIDKLQMTVPEGWTAKYDEKLDKWMLEAPKLPDGPAYSYAYIERAPASAVASPDAYLAYLRKDLAPTTKAEIASRSGVKDGFAMTAIIQAPGGRPTRTTVVVRELGSGWYQCFSTWIEDDAIRDQLLALCKSLKL